MHLRCTLEHEKSTKGSFSLPLTLTLSPKGRGDFRGNPYQLGFLWSQVGKKLSRRAGVQLVLEVLPSRYRNVKF